MDEDRAPEKKKHREARPHARDRRASRQPMKRLTHGGRLWILTHGCARHPCPRGLRVEPPNANECRLRSAPFFHDGASGFNHSCRTNAWSARRSSLASRFHSFLSTVDQRLHVKQPRTDAGASDAKRLCPLLSILYCWAHAWGEAMDPNPRYIPWPHPSRSTCVMLLLRAWPALDLNG